MYYNVSVLSLTRDDIVNLFQDHVASEMVATLTSNVHDALLDGLMTQPQADCLLKNVTDTMKSSTYLSLKKK
jgi:hypothetical protein